MKLIIATNSPRRREILKRFRWKVEFVNSCKEVEPKDIKDYKRLLYQKARSKIQCIETQNLIIGMDTIVRLEETILGKPKNIEEARYFLQLLSGRTHLVDTGVLIRYGHREMFFIEETEVKFSVLSENEINFLLSNTNPFDKAGGYGIQDLAGMFIEGIKGDYLNVVGLPLNRLYKVLRKEFGLKMSDIIAGA